MTVGGEVWNVMEWGVRRRQERSIRRLGNLSMCLIK